MKKRALFVLAMSVTMAFSSSVYASPHYVETTRDNTETANYSFSVNDHNHNNLTGVTYSWGNQSYHPSISYSTYVHGQYHSGTLNQISSSLVSESHNIYTVSCAKMTTYRGYYGGYVNQCKYINFLERFL